MQFNSPGQSPRNCLCQGRGRYRFSRLIAPADPVTGTPHLHPGGGSGMPPDGCRPGREAAAGAAMAARIGDARR